MKHIKGKAPATPASVTSAKTNNQLNDTTKNLICQAECVSEVSQTDPTTKDPKVQDVIIRILKSCELANEYGRKKTVPNKYFKQLSINSTESEIQDFCNVIFEDSKIQYEPDELNKEICMLYFSIIAQEYIEGLKEAEKYI